MTSQYWEDYFDGLHASLDYPNEDDDFYDAERDMMSHCQYEYKTGQWCGQQTIGDGCEQCGKPLCPMHMETGANFCDTCPTADYVPYYMQPDNGPDPLYVRPDMPPITEDDIPF